MLWASWLTDPAIAPSQIPVPRINARPIFPVFLWRSRTAMLKMSPVSSGITTPPSTRSSFTSISLGTPATKTLALAVPLSSATRICKSSGLTHLGRCTVSFAHAGYSNAGGGVTRQPFSATISPSTRTILTEIVSRSSRIIKSAIFPGAILPKSRSRRRCSATLIVAI